MKLTNPQKAFLRRWVKTWRYSVTELRISLDRPCYVAADWREQQTVDALARRGMLDTRTATITDAGVRASGVSI